MAVAQKKHVKTNGPRSAPGGPFQGPFVEVNGCLDLLVIWSLPATPPSEITATPPDSHSSGAYATGHTARADAARNTAGATAVAVLQCDDGCSPLACCAVAAD